MASPSDTPLALPFHDVPATSLFHSYRTRLLLFPKAGVHGVHHILQSLCLIRAVGDQLDLRTALHAGGSTETMDLPM